MTNIKFTFHITIVFSCLHRFKSMIIFVKLMFPNKTTLHVYMWGFQIPHRLKSCITCQCTNYHNTTNYMSTYHDLNCFSHNNLAKLLTPSGINIITNPWSQSDFYPWICCLVIFWLILSLAFLGLFRHKNIIIKPWILFNWISLLEIY